MLIKIEPTATGKNGRIFFAIEINKPKSRKKNAITLPENAVAGAFFPEMNQVGKKNDQSDHERNRYWPKSFLEIQAAGIF